ncbi:MAG: CPBP family intramembrane metalloprotease [Sphingomonadaceae bacterium]|nr:CPBP family intramembrane metalloprotease [Sphingomonadaceae bacterium]MBJ7389335.1 CPBP family intramembrane metalloprotease [Sphingomonadaceae bacterium]
MTNPKASRTGIWRDAFQVFPDLWAFLKHPTVGEATYIWTPLIWRQILLLFLFDLVLLLPIYFYFVGYDEFLLVIGTETPENTGFDDYDSLWTLWLSIGLVAPLVEEPMFRGWLKGTPRQLLLLALMIGTLLLLLALGPINDLPPWGFVFLVMAFIAAVATALLEIEARTQSNAPTVPMFDRHFRTIFWTSAVLFGLVHVSNYEGGTVWAAVPMVLPQLTAGLLLGFARLRFGIRASILLHSASNSILIPLIVLSSS